MSRVKLQESAAVLIDTNILIDYIDGYSEPKQCLAAIAQPAISIVTWIEVLAGARNPQEEALFKTFLESWQVIALTPEIADAAAQARRSLKIKLPDAIIWATAQTQRRKLYTRNSKDFSANHPDVVVPYQLKKTEKRSTAP